MEKNRIFIATYPYGYAIVGRYNVNDKIVYLSKGSKAYKKDISVLCSRLGCKVEALESALDTIVKKQSSEKIEGTQYEICCCSVREKRKNTVIKFCISINKYVEYEGQTSIRP